MKRKEAFEQLLFDPFLYEQLDLDQRYIRTLRTRFYNDKVDESLMKELLLKIERVRFKEEDWKLPKSNTGQIKNLGKKLKAKPRKNSKKL